MTCRKVVIVQAFITCHLDNNLFSAITDSVFRRLESVQNAVARLITGTGRCDHITPLLREFHWLPVRQRVEFKLAALVYKSLHGLTAPYLTNDCQLVANSGRRRLRSAESTQPVVRTNNRLSDRSFTVAGPRFWNTLPAELRRPDIELVRRLLKRHLFTYDPGAW